MGDTYAIAGLERKRAEIVREIAGAEDRLAYLRTSLVHIDATIALFDPEREPPGGDPILKRAQSGYFADGELPRIDMELMRDNQGRSAIELTEIIMVQRGIPTTDRTARYLIRKKVAGAVRKVRKRLAG
ncbi:hypothetical protein EDC65_2186 [Stella humosa]|uniref:Uncharacterized protein n=1 Tax=Stella humosa TaxID=94 RepID=A0A3N1MAU8_9PROT|nr:hypothetical protein [Stella humosa]ROQ00389.1 hypothetical protein EDC65_2186 [Stella humosa]BBK30368.1 hypothetical protein STHU_10020 [Stella humosa]